MQNGPKQINQGAGQATAPTAPDLKTLATQIAERTQDAYCAERYANWTGCAKAILDCGFTEKETEVILRSKWMRWAADVDGSRFGRVPATAIRDALCYPAKILGPGANFRALLDEMVALTFGDEA